MTGRTMPLMDARPTSPIVRRLGGFATLSEAEEQALLQLSAHRERHRAGEELIREGDPARRPRFVVSGWAMSQRVLADGRRQIFRFLLPGDGIGVYPPVAPPALHTIVAATTLETVDAEPVLTLVREARAPGLVRALAAAARIEDGRLLDQLIRLGRHTAYERVTHLLLELYDRLSSVGLAERDRFPLPLTQEVLADTLGLSIVHVNRTLQHLRRDGLIEWRAGTATLLQRDLMVDVADYRALRADKIRVI